VPVYPPDRPATGFISVSTNRSRSHRSKSSWPHRASSNFWPHPAGAGTSWNLPGQTLFPGAKSSSRWGRNFFADAAGGAKRSWFRVAGTSSWNQFISALGGRSRASGRRKLSSARAAVRDAALWLACAACVAASAAGCTAAESGTPAAGTASAGSGCARALQAVSSYGPSVVRDAVGAKKIQDTVEADLIVLALDAAADAAGDPAARQSIRNLASAYSRFRDGWTSAIAPSMEAILADTRRLDSVCGS